MMKLLQPNRDATRAKLAARRVLTPQTPQP